MAYKTSATTNGGRNGRSMQDGGGLALPKDSDGRAAKVICEVTLNPAGGFSLAANLKVSIPGADKDNLQALIEEAHTIRPYAKATRGNIPVTRIAA
jgi:organic hydroperoxide reductase OsmC/OhrA